MDLKLQSLFHTLEEFVEVVKIDLRVSQFPGDTGEAVELRKKVLRCKTLFLYSFGLLEGGKRCAEVMVLWQCSFFLV